MPVADLLTCYLHGSLPWAVAVWVAEHESVLEPTWDGRVTPRYGDFAE